MISHETTCMPLSLEIKRSLIFTKKYFFSTKQKPYTSNLNVIRFFPPFITPQNKIQKHQQTCQMIAGLWVLPLLSSTSTSIDEGAKERVFGKLTKLGFWFPLSFSPPSVTTAIFGPSLTRGRGLLKKGTLSSNFGKNENRVLGFWELSFWVTILLFSVSAIVF